jgi:general secretion pathway protein B
MSSILKALQKLEREREVRQGKPANIHKGILREDRRLRKGKAWSLFLPISVTALAAALLTYVVTGKNTGSSPVAPASKPISTAPEAARPVPSSSVPTGNRVVTPVIRQSPPPVIETASGQKQQSDRQIQQAATPVPQHQPAVAAPQPVAPPPQAKLNVSGIGWREEPASRIAVINGSPVGEGALIDGAKVEEIFPDRVRFSAGKKLFDVPVGTSAIPH